MLIERPTCPICRCADRKLFYELKIAKWVICSRCYFIYQPTIERLPEMAALLRRQSEPYRTDKKIEDFDLRPEAKAAAYRSRVQRYQKYKDRGELVVELGFGGGDILHWLRLQRRWRRIVGIEIVERYVAHARSLGFDARWCDLARGAPADLLWKADLVIANEVMEHVEAPLSFLRNIRTLLKPKGWAALSFATTSRRSRLSSSEFQYWTPLAVETLLKRTGYDLDRCRMRFASRTGFVWVRR